MELRRARRATTNEGLSQLLAEAPSDPIRAWEDGHHIGLLPPWGVDHLAMPLVVEAAVANPLRSASDRTRLESFKGGELIQVKGTEVAAGLKAGQVSILQGYRLGRRLAVAATSTLSSLGNQTVHSGGGPSNPHE